MADYFVADNTNANGNGDAAMTGGAVQPAAEGDAMADEILVCLDNASRFTILTWQQ